MRTGETGALGYRSPLWKQGAPGQGQTLLPLAVRVDAVPNVVHDHKLSVAVNASPDPAELCCRDGTEVLLDRRLEGNSVASHLA